MKTLGYILLAALILFLAFPQKVMAWFNKPAANSPADGTACTLPDNTTGEYKGGVCVRKIDVEPPLYLRVKEGYPVLPGTLVGTNTVRFTV